jgi:hypothetical protein
VQPTTRGATATLAATTPGQRIALRFRARAGRRYLVRVRDVGIDTAQEYGLGVALVSPDGSALDRPADWSPSAYLFELDEPARMPSRRPYEVRVDPQHDGVGRVTLDVFAIPHDVRIGLRPGETSTPVALSPGQRLLATFRGRPGQRLSARVLDHEINGDLAVFGLEAAAVDASGAPLATTRGLSLLAGGDCLPLRALRDARRNAITIDPDGDLHGQLRVQLHRGACPSGP